MPQAQQLAARGRLVPAAGSRLVLQLPETSIPNMVRMMRETQMLGDTGFGLCPAPPLPADAALRAAFSAARFPGCLERAPGMSLSEIAIEPVPIFCFGYPFVMS